ncbi:cellulose biosynthesis cyclic di-GMP-binding regulatory protein BcsB [Devosia sp. FKR38]|uniref:cellulose biosynthesis cyclic di-GMP-binding regulatory protein BcsB n=1 Tax=Devosia sp. FKR38 TaxID=2562312 RepID=UPI0010C02BBF|nr:cellulose biosynthesis cyclic di-GMP-binding regulatory protein BcsB [Devosia sp. FKR38]
MIRTLSSIAFVVLAGPAIAQTAPHFDMTPEAGLVTPGEAAPESATPVVVAESPAFVRYLLPSGDARLAGEVDRRNYQIYLTAAQVQAQASLSLGYINALVVAPESSRLRVQINGTTVLLNPIASAASIAKLEVDVPAGVLVPGFNTVTISADQRHRTDCTIESTYELWSDISSADTFLRFSGPRLGEVTRLDDIAAVGWTAAGNSVIRVILPAGSAMQHGALLADMVQSLALSMRVANSDVQYATALPSALEPGVLNVLVAPAGDLPGSIAPLAVDARTGPVAEFAPSGTNTLVLSGPDWDGVARALDEVRLVAEHYPQPDNSLPPRADAALPVRELDGAGTLSFAEMGFEGLSFNGRRYRTSFSFALPQDFYATHYGQAQITLNAAYSSDVLPGSRFDVFVNGHIASVTPILRTDDALRDLPLKVPMTDFHPGINTLEIVAALRTQADDVCAPGTVTVGADQRLLISSNSTFTVPDFGRASQVPNLSAFANTGFPYVDDAQPNLVIGSGEDSLPAALTFLSRMAGQTNRVIPIGAVSLASPSPAQDAIFVGAYGQLPPDSIQRIGVLQPYASDDNALEAGGGDLDEILQRWRSNGGSGDQSLVGRLQTWIAGVLDLGPNSLGILPPPDEPYAPRLSDRAVLLQTLQDEGGLWTMLTIPNATALKSGVDLITSTAIWPNMAGRVSVVPSDQSTIQVVEPNHVAFSTSDGWNFFNLRNVVTNWVSSHTLAYALGLCLVLVGLTLATAGVLGITRRSVK